MNANELAEHLEKYFDSEPYTTEVTTMLRQQQAEIEALKNANRFIQNFAQEQHQRAVALEMRELTDEEIMNCIEDKTGYLFNACDEDLLNFAKAILRKASEK